MLFVEEVDDPLGAMSDNIPRLLRDCIEDGVVENFRLDSLVVAGCALRGHVFSTASCVSVVRN